MRRFALVAIVVSFALSGFAGTLQVVPTTTLAAETGNNTSTSNLFVATGNGDLGAGNVSKIDTHSLLYPGFSGKIFAHLMGWFCMNAGSTATGAGTLCGSHVQIGYTSSDPAVVQAQVTDMISRGFDGVIHDWYGPGNSRDDVQTKNLFKEAEQHAGFEVALMIDQGAIKWYSCYTSGCTATQALTQIAQYASQNFFSSPAYMRINGRPVLTNFDIDLHYTVDWNYVAANTPGNPIFIFQNNGGFTHGLSAGSYSWVMPTNSNFGLDYLGSFYSTGMKYPSELTVGAMYKGFNDTLASWSGNRIMSQQCGQTWLQTFAKANSMYDSSNQLGAIQLVTWDDYEEGTELESGIDNCFSVSGSMSGTKLNWTVSGSENTIDHYTVFISTDGQNLMSLGDFPVGTRQLDLSGYSPVVGTTYTLFVKATGKPSIRNQMSAPVTFAYLSGLRMVSPSNGTTVGSPVNVNASAVSSNPISAMVVYLDYNEVYRTYSGSVSTSLKMNAGSHLLVINAWDSAGMLMQAKATINVVTQSPVAMLSLSSTAAVAPATITASTSATDPNNGGTIVSSSINWGDGTSSAGPNASHTYSASGSYTATATVTDNYGLSASTSQALTITAPAITITSPSSGAIVTSPVHVTANAVSGLPISTIVVYLDHNEVYRTNSNTVDTSVPMSTGQHLLVTNAWDSSGLLMQAQTTITVASGPTAVLSLSAISGVAPVTVTASTAGSTDAYASITASTVDWGDGTTSAGPAATHTYNSAGNYSVTAKVTDSLGLSSTSAAQTVTVQAATVTITSPANGATVNSPIQVSANAVSGLTISSMTILLDGNSVYSTAGALVSTAVAAAPGAHTIVVKATDSVGATLQSSVAVGVTAQPITASLSVLVSTVSPVTVTASTAGSTDPNVGGTLNSSINWGDGTASTGANATHTYAAGGTFTVTATVTDNYGRSASKSQQVTIKPGAPTAAMTVSVSGTSAIASTTGSTDPNAGATLTSVINWGDGSNAAGPSATHTYAAAGTFTITAMVTDSYGMSSSASQQVTIKPGAPTAALTTSVSGTTVTASTAGSTDPNPGSTLTSVIQWGDGAISAGPTAVHTYAKPGVYGVTATVTNNYGLPASMTGNVTAAGIVIWSPSNGSTVQSPLHVSATAYDAKRIASMTVYVDNTKKYTINSNTLDAYIKANRGTHRIVINAWEDVTGVLFQASATVTVP